VSWLSRVRRLEITRAGSSRGRQTERNREAVTSDYVIINQREDATANRNVHLRARQVAWTLSILSARILERCLCTRYRRENARHGSKWKSTISSTEEETTIVIEMPPARTLLGSSTPRSWTVRTAAHMARLPACGCTVDDAGVRKASFRWKEASHKDVIDMSVQAQPCNPAGNYSPILRRSLPPANANVLCIAR